MRSGHLPYARDTVYGIGWESISTTATKDYTLTSTSPEAIVYSDRGNRVSIYINYSGRNGHWGLIEVSHSFESVPHNQPNRSAALAAR